MSAAASTEPGALPAYRLSELVNYALKLGTTGFGGPVALVGYMHRDLVEGRRWISEEQYREGLALAQLAPGPLAAQVAIYYGVRSLPSPWGNAGGDGFRSALIPHRRCAGLGLRPLRRTAVDTSRVLRCWRCGDWHHC